jgi:ABC-type branched-subunit amino acid transport system ATPase component
LISQSGGTRRADAQAQRTAPPTALRAMKMRKVYGSMVAVDDLSFTVEPGEIVGLLGPNGAGKTTTINMILGVLQPTGGGVLIGEIDLAKNRARALAGTNFAAVYAALPGNLTVAENLRFFGLLYGIKDLRRRVELRPRLSSRRPHRTVGALQRRERGVADCGRSGLCQILPTFRYNEVVLVPRPGSGNVTEGHRGPREI